MSCRWSFEGRLARNAFLRDSICTKPCVFPDKVRPRTSMIYLCGATGARRSRVWSDHGRIMLGSCSDRFRIGVAAWGMPQWFVSRGVSDFPSKNPFKKCFKIVLHNNSTWLDDKESDDEVLRRQYRHLWEAVRSFEPEFVDAEMKRRQGLAAEVSTLVGLPRAGCALLWTASGCELLCFSSFAFHLSLRTAECLGHLVLVSVCVVTNRTKNHDRIAYMWKKHAVVGAGKCKVSLRSAQCFMQHGLDFCSLLKVWFSGPFPFSDIRPQAGWDGMFRVYLTSVEWDGWLGIYNLDAEVRFVFLGP